MAKLFAIYEKPADTAAFDDYSFNQHLPRANTLPGLRSYEVSSGDVIGMANFADAGVDILVGETRQA
ncbi:MAG: EthD family reductase [Polaromonas sp.]